MSSPVDGREMIRHVSRSFIFIYGSGLSKAADKVIVSLESLSQALFVHLHD